MPASWIRYRFIGFNHGRVEHIWVSIHRVLDSSRHSWAASQQLHTANVTLCRIAPCMLRLCACSLVSPLPFEKSRFQSVCL